MKIVLAFVLLVVISGCVCDPEDRDTVRRYKEMKEKAEATS